MINIMSYAMNGFVQYREKRMKANRIVWLVLLMKLRFKAMLRRYGTSRKDGTNIGAIFQNRIRYSFILCASTLCTPLSYLRSTGTHGGRIGRAKTQKFKLPPFVDMKVMEHKAMFRVLLPFVEEKVFIQKTIAIFRNKYLMLLRI